MAKKRKFCAYRLLEARPYTRISKYRSKSYIRTKPNNLIVKFDMGNLTKDFEYRIDLISSNDLQIRHNAFESARQIANRYLEKNVGKLAFHLKIRTYPHHVLRENPLASGAGADRMSTGMKMAFGKPIGIAARIRKGQPVMSAFVDKAGVDFAREALHRSASKFPSKFSIQVDKIVA